MQHIVKHFQEEIFMKNNFDDLLEQNQAEQPENQEFDKEARA
jgi:hypothetical protein